MSCNLMQPAGSDIALWPLAHLSHVSQETGAEAGCSRERRSPQRQRCQEERASGGPCAVAGGHLRGGVPGQRQRCCELLRSGFLATVHHEPMFLWS